MQVLIILVQETGSFIYALINIFLKTSSYEDIRKEAIQMLERRKRAE